jgi:8-hydroxy-5-deazaflavin:NADPH oxidoreductase
MTKGAAMKIGIIGAGNIGATLARHFTKLHHSVLVANSRGPETLKQLAQETGATPVPVVDAATGVDLLVITIPMKSVPLLPAGFLKGLSENAIVLDTCNYYPSFRDGVIQQIEDGLTESEWVAQQLRHPVTKVFNNIMAHSLANGALPKGRVGRIALPVAGADRLAKAQVIKLLDAIGFDGLDAGTLQESWRQQPGTPAYCTDLDAAALPEALASADRSKSAQMREESVKKMMSLPPDTPARELVRLARAMWPSLPQS